MHTEEIEIAVSGVRLEGELVLPRRPRGLVAFAHGSGSSRRSPRNRYVADRFSEHGLGTVLFDLLTAAEEEHDRATALLRFDVALLSERLTGTVEWLARHPAAAPLPLGLFGASTGAAAALDTAARRSDRVGAVVSRGGRPDLGGEPLSAVSCPVLLIVGGSDPEVLRLNRDAAKRLGGEHHVHVVAGASHLFPEPGAMEEVADLGRKWFTRHLGGG